MSKPITTIAPHTSIKGDLRLDGPAVIGGHVHGNVTATDALEIGPEGIVDGNIQGAAVTIHGTVKGNIVASGECRLGAGAYVAGDLSAASLATARGARFIGQVNLGDDMAGPAEQAADPMMRSHDVDVAAVDRAEEAAAVQVVEATINRIEQLAPRLETQVTTAPVSMTMPAMPAVTILTQNVQATLHRAPRIIKAR